MSIIGIVVITAVMACAVAGAIAALFDSDKGLGKEFKDGLHAIGYIFVPVAGIMASIPFLSAFVRAVVGQAFAAIGADPAMAATSVIAVDMGGYQLADRLAETRESWIMAMLTGYMAGATIVFSIPVGLSLLEKRDHKYMALGVLAGLLSIPVGVLVASLLLLMLGPHVRPDPSTNAEATHALQLTLPTILLNLAPLAVFMGLLALGLRLAPDKMIRGFMAFGRGMTILITLVLVAWIVQYFTSIFYGQGLFSLVFGAWDFDPIIADFDQIDARIKAHLPVRSEDVTRALEVAGYIGLMLSGAFPMVYLIKKYLAGPMGTVGRKLGLDAVGAAGILAAAANILAMFHLVKDMRPKDKVLNIAFAVCAAFLFGDHLAFTANFQPNLLLPVMLGKLAGGVCGFALAYWLCVPRALQMEQEEMDEEVRQIIALVPELHGRQVSFRPLGGGLTNRNYFLETLDGERYVLRIAGEGTEVLGIDRDREVACARAAAEAGVAPEVVYFNHERRALVIRFAPGRALRVTDLRRPDVLERVIRAVRRFHGQHVTPEVGTFSPFETMRDYHRLAREGHVPLPPELGWGLEILDRLEAELRELRKGEPPCLCHNDLLAGNFLDNGTAVYIIDWEYGGAGDRFFDLGNFAVNQELSEEENRALLTHYFGEARSEHLRRLKRMRLVSDMREAMWGYLQAGVSRLHTPGYYLDYGRKHLDRFLAGSRELG